MNIDVTQAWPMLNAANESDAVWWTAAELYRFADEAVKRLARTTGALVTRDYTTLATVASQGAYAIPARHVSTIHLSVDSSAMLPATHEELEVLDDAWTAAAAGTPTRFAQDRDTAETLNLYPQPASGGKVIAMVMHQFPVAVDGSHLNISVPECFKLHSLAAMVAGARGREGKGAMPEVAGWLSGIVGLMESTARVYYGGAE